MNFIIFSFAVAAVSSLSGCTLDSSISSLVDHEELQLVRPSQPFVGVIVSAGTRSSGGFVLEGSVGNSAPNAVRNQDSFTFYGGISGEVFSR